MLLPFCPLELCLFSIVYKSDCFASFALPAGDAEKTVLKYPLAGGGAAAPAAAGADFFFASIGRVVGRVVFCVSGCGRWA